MRCAIWWPGGRHTVYDRSRLKTQENANECNLFQTSRYLKTSTRAATYFFFRYFSSYVCTFGLKQEAVWAKHRGFPGHAAARRLELSILKPKSGFRDPIWCKSALYWISNDLEIPISCKTKQHFTEVSICTCSDGDRSCTFTGFECCTAQGKWQTFHPGSCHGQAQGFRSGTRCVVSMYRLAGWCRVHQRASWWEYQMWIDVNRCT